TPRPAALRRQSAAPERPVCVRNGESFKRSLSGLRGLASAERFLSTLLYFCCRQLLQVRCDCPYEPERILHFSIPVAPELVPIGDTTLQPAARVFAQVASASGT